MGGGFHYRLRASFYGTSSGERTSGLWTGWVQLCGACAGIAFNAGEWPLLTLTVPVKNLFLKGKCHRLCGLRRRGPTFV